MNIQLGISAETRHHHDRDRGTSEDLRDTRETDEVLWIAIFSYMSYRIRMHRTRD